MKNLEHQARKIVVKYRGCGSTLTKKAHLDRAQDFGKFCAHAGLNSMEHIGLKVVQKYMQHLKDKGLGNSALSNHASTVRIIAARVGKPDMIPRSNKQAFGFSRTKVERMQPIVRNDAERDAAAKFSEKIVAYGRTETTWAGLAYRMTQEFGLRRLEALRSNQIIERDGRQYLKVEGAKGGKPRQVEITTDAQRKLLTEVHAHIKENRGKSLMPKDLNQKQAVQIYSNIVHRAGGTKCEKLHSHANRHQDLQDQKAVGATDKEIADRSGHGREKISGHYVPGV